MILFLLKKDVFGEQIQKWVDEYFTRILSHFMLIGKPEIFSVILFFEDLAFLLSLPRMMNFSAGLNYFFLAVLRGIWDNIDATECVDIGRCEDVKLTR